MTAKEYYGATALTEIQSRSRPAMLFRVASIHACWAVLAVLLASPTTRVGVAQIPTMDRQQQAVAKLEEFGGSVRKFPGFGLVSLDSRWRGGDAGLEILVDLRVHELTVDCADFTGKSLEKLLALPELHALRLVNTSVSPHALRLLAKVPSLDVLELTNATDEMLASLEALDLSWLTVQEASDVTDAGLKHLQAMRRLICLRLLGCAVSGAPIAEYQCRGEIREVVIDSPGVDDRFIACLREFGKLNRLDLSGTRLSGSTLAQLSSMPRLREVVLNNTLLSDSGLVQLATIRSLEAVSLDGTQTTDEGLHLLQPLENLRFVSLQNTQVTDEGLKHLAGMPHLISVVNREGTFVVFKKDWLERPPARGSLPQGKKVLLWTEGELKEWRR